MNELNQLKRYIKMIDDQLNHLNYNIKHTCEESKDGSCPCDIYNRIKKEIEDWKGLKEYLINKINIQKLVIKNEVIVQEAIISEFKKKYQELRNSVDEIMAKIQTAHLIVSALEEKLKEFHKDPLEENKSTIILYRPYD